MSGRVNWSRVSSRQRMRRQGVEDRRGATSVAPLPEEKPQHRRAPSKVELREQAEAAVRAWWESQFGGKARKPNSGVRTQLSGKNYRQFKYLDKCADRESNAWCRVGYYNPLSDCWAL